MKKEPTPMMKQWHACKEEAKDALLLFRLGDFYEAFYDDATIISKEADLTLTQRQNIPMCGMPFHSCENYIDRLLAKGYKIAIAEQMADPKEVKGLVQRKIVRILTPATVMEGSLLSDKKNNYFVSIEKIGKLFGLAIIDLSTAEFRIFETEDSKMLFNELCSLKPKEILVSEKFREKQNFFLEELSHFFNFLINSKENWIFDFDIASKKLLSHFSIFSLDSFGFADYLPSISAAGALLSYLEETLLIPDNHLKTLTKQNSINYLSIDATCMKNLELIESSDEKNTLLFHLDKTRTAMGGRLLKNWIQKPLISEKSIIQRQAAIEELINNFFLKDEIQYHLDRIRDLERLLIRLECNYSNPKDLVSLRFSIEQLPFLKTTLSKLNADLFKTVKKDISDDITLISQIIQEAIIDNPPFRLSDGNIFKEGYSQELDELKMIAKNAKAWIANYQNILREETNIKNLKVGYTKAFGYYIEISKGQKDKIPASFQRRQTLVNAERCVTDELKNFEEKALSAEEKIRSLESKLFQELKEKLIPFHEKILKAAKVIAVIDSLFSLASTAESKSYTKPIIDHSNVLSIKEGRHPIIESTTTNSKFIPNDTYLDEKKHLFLITGPNMAGKSTYIRQVALITIMAQIGSFVPASFCRIGIVDKVFSRIGASDDLAKGQSTFMVEMTEAANILNNATEKSLVILDEIGRGTSTYDGISIAWAISEFLLNKKTKTLFATHYWELTDLEKKYQGAANYQVAVKETAKTIVFLHKIIQGGTDKSYGIHVAKLAGLPISVLKKAEEKLKTLEKKPIKKEIQPDLFSHDQSFKFQSLKETILSMNLNETSPLDALKNLYELQSRVKNGF